MTSIAKQYPQDPDSPLAQPTRRSVTAFNPLVPLDGLLSSVGLSRDRAGGSVSFAGEDPIVSSAHRLGACIGIPMMANAIAALALHRLRDGPAQDLHLDLRQAVHSINPSAFWHPTLNGEPAPHPLVLDNPFLAMPYRSADGRWVMATGVYPRLAAMWCRFLDVPPDIGRVAAAVRAWNAFELEEAASAAHLPVSVVRTPGEWLAHAQGALLATQPVIGLERIGDAPARDLGPARRPSDGIRVLSFTHAVAGPTVGRTLAEHGADVLCATRPNDYEHEFIYDEANVGSRSAYLDLDSETGRKRLTELLLDADVVVNNHRGGSLERDGLDPRELAERHRGLVHVSVTCYGSDGPWAERGGFDMNGSAASGLMSIEGSQAEPKLPATGLINDYITGYLGAIGAAAALVKRATEGGSWHVTVNLTRTSMWCGSLGLVDPALAGSDDEHSLREPTPYDAPSPLGDVHMLAPPVRFSRTPPSWPDPILVPRGSSRAEWRTRPGERSLAASRRMGRHANSERNRACRRGDQPDDFLRLGLDTESVAAWEDGLRTDTAPGSYEWWYFDAHLDDGSTLVIVFYTKNPLTPDHRLAPYVTVHLERRGAAALSFECHSSAEQFTADKDLCDVRIAENSFRGDLHDYEIHVAHEDITIDVKLTGQVRPWRPGTGHVYFGKDHEHFFAWLPSVPQGEVSVELTSGARRQRHRGIGYHDHNWGDAPMPKLINHWYWGRAQAGPYSIISSYVTADRRYGDAEIPTFLLAKGAEIIADDPEKVQFRLEDEHIDGLSGKPVADVIIYEYEDGDDLYRVSFRRAETIADRKLIDEVPGIKHLVARLARFDGAYLRFTGGVQLEYFLQGTRIEDVNDHGIWELMYFGRTR